MIILWTNNATTTLAAPITNVATTMTVAAGTGTRFPFPAAGQYFKLTLVDAGTGLLREIVHVTDNTADVFTIVRAQESTTARAWALNDPCANLWTAGTAQAMLQTVSVGTAAYLNASDQLGGVSATQPYAGNPNGHVAGNAAAGALPPSMVWDTVNQIFWVCTTTGTTSTAAWTAMISGGSSVYCGTSTGSANAQVATPAVPIVLTAGVSLAILAGYTNTNAMTLNVSGTGAKNVYKEGPSGPIPLTGGEWVAGNLVTVRYDGTQYQLVATELGTAALANASSNTGVVAAVSGSTVSGHIALFNNTTGTIVDGGVPAASAAPVYLNFSNNGALLGSGVYNVDTTTASGGAFSSLLPASPTNGQSIGFNDAFLTWDSNNYTISRNGHTIMGSATDMVCNVKGLNFQLIYNTTLSDWRLE